MTFKKKYVLDFYFTNNPLDDELQFFRLRLSSHVVL